MSHLPPQNPNNDPHIQGAGHPRNAPTPAPYGRYNPPVGQTSAAGFGSIDPVLMEAQRKRAATRPVSVAGSIIGLITMMIQIIFTASIVAGLPTLAIFLTWFWQIHHGIGGTDTYVLFTVLVASYLVQVLIAVGFIVLLRRSKALDPSVRVS